MRKHIYLITEHEDDNRHGLIEITDSRLSGSSKDEETPIRVRDEEEQGFPIVGKRVSCGYVDFESEEEYEDDDTLDAEVKRKLGEIDESHLKKAGHDPGELFADA